MAGDRMTLEETRDSLLTMELLRFMHTQPEMAACPITPEASVYDQLPSKEKVLTFINTLLTKSRRRGAFLRAFRFEAYKKLADQEDTDQTACLLGDLLRRSNNTQEDQESMQLLEHRLIQLLVHIKPMYTQ